MRFTKDDVGCWIDCAYGTDHALSKLQLMLDSARGDGEVSKLGQELADATPEDEFVYELIEDATDALYAYTEDGLVWTWEAGDLILTTEDQMDF